MMKSEDAKIEALSRSVLRVAHDEAEQVLAVARKQSETVRQQAAQQVDGIRAALLTQANREAQRIRSEAISAAHLKARTQQLAQREKLLDEVFEAAQQQLNTIQQGTDYEEIAHRLLREALYKLKAEEALIHADKMTASFFTDDVLDTITQEIGVKALLGTVLEHGIGVIVETPDGHRQYDNTLQTRLVRFWDSLRMPVYHLLMGEPL